MQKNKVLSTAQKLLLEHPYDLAHDIFHHNQVWVNIVTIVLAEELQPDMEKLEIAAWWHDVDRDTKQHEQMVHAMLEAGYTEAQALEIKNLINTHSFDDERSESIESKLLFDADKIEYVNPGRHLLDAEGRKQGKLSSDAATKYEHALQARVFAVSKELHFETSRKLMLQNLQVFIPIVSQIKKTYGYMQGVEESELLRTAQYLDTTISQPQHS